MLRVILVTLFIIFSYASTAVQANDISTRTDICKLISAFANEGGVSGTSELAKMFSYDASAQSKAEHSFGMLKEFDYIEGSAFLVVGLDDLYKQYFVVMNVKEKGNLYFAMEFEKVDGELRLLRFAFADRFENVANDYGGFTQKPEKIDC
jgi:hypothetical protein